MIAAKQPIGTPTVASAWPARIHRIWLNQYHQMIATGVLQEDDPIELIDGCLVTKMPRDPAHDWTLNQLAKKLEKEFGDAGVVRVQSAITAEHSEPEPDIAVVRPPDDYQERHPSGEDALLVVEIANSSLDFDRSVKADVYSYAGVREYWIINLIDRQIEIHRLPRSGKPGGFHERRTYLAHEEIELTLGKKSLAKWMVASLLLKAKSGR